MLISVFSNPRLLIRLKIKQLIYLAKNLDLLSKFIIITTRV
jgi:hypothetical protein